MYCTECGTENADDAKFCKNCGQTLQRTSMPVWTDAESGVREPVKRKNNGARILLIVGLVIVAIGIGVMLLLALWNVRKEKRFEENLESGQKYLEEEEYEKAAACFDEAISIDPKQVDPYRYAAQAYIGMEDYSHAEDIYENVVDYITAEYDEERKLPAGSEAVYKEAILYYGGQGNSEKAEILSREIYDMTEDEDEKAEVKGLMLQFGMYRKYYDLIERYQEEFGEAAKASAGEYMKYLKGLCMAKLVDFDLDGSEELLLVYADPETVGPSGSYMLPRYIIEVWRYAGTDIEKVFEGSGFGGDGGTSDLYFTQDENGSYIIEGGQDDFQYNEIWGLVGDEFSVVKEVNAESYSDDGPYTIDGNLVSYEEFDAEISKWMANCTVYGLSRIEESQDRSLAELEETLKLLREKLEIDEEQGEDLEQETPAVTSQMYLDIYGPIVQEVYAGGGQLIDYNLYYVYDIDKDGVKELLVQKGNGEFDYMYQIYTIQEQAAVYLGEISGFHTVFYADESGGKEPYIIRLSGHMGYEEIYHVSITEGKVEEQEVSYRELGADEEYYSNPYPIDCRYLSDLSLLQ